MKTCVRCKVEKSIDCFGPDKRNRDGLRSYCKNCVTEYNREREKSPAYKEKRRKQVAARAKNPEYKAKQAQWRKNTRARKKSEDLKRNRTPSVKARNAWYSAKRRADKRGQEFTLSKERLLVAFELGLCELTGLEFDFNQELRVGKGRSPLSPSVDRIDPLKPYSDDNVRVVCDWYNMAKGQLSPEKLLEYCERLLIANNYRVEKL